MGEEEGRIERKNNDKRTSFGNRSVGRKCLFLLRGGETFYAPAISIRTGLIRFRIVRVIIINVARVRSDSRMLYIYICVRPVNRARKIMYTTGARAPIRDAYYY